MSKDHQTKTAPVGIDAELVLPEAVSIAMTEIGGAVKEWRPQLSEFGWRPVTADGRWLRGGRVRGSRSRPWCGAEQREIGEGGQDRLGSASAPRRCRRRAGRQPRGTTLRSSRCRGRPRLTAAPRPTTWRSSPPLQHSDPGVAPPAGRRSQLAAETRARVGIDRAPILADRVAPASAVCSGWFGRRSPSSRVQARAQLRASQRRCSGRG